jgi:hypothetical protein
VIHLEILSGKAAGQSMLVRRFPFTVGRTSVSHLRSDDSGVWDQHFRIEPRRSEGLFLIPFEQAVTLLDGQEVESPTRLNNGAEISAGAMNIRFNIADSKVRSGRYRETATWLAIGLVTALQAWLLIALPK